ncbi:MAG: hypothetical protein HYY95_16255 [Candidatus Rokubacteria bacterium]|nr:hypothetical protein [Candidatus Rokubacteria bacterium]
MTGKVTDRRAQLALRPGAAVRDLKGERALGARRQRKGRQRTTTSLKEPVRTNTFTAAGSSNQ